MLADAQAEDDDGSASEAAQEAPELSTPANANLPNPLEALESLKLPFDSPADDAADQQPAPLSDSDGGVIDVTSPLAAAAAKAAATVQGAPVADLLPLAAALVLGLGGGLLFTSSQVTSQKKVRP